MLCSCACTHLPNSLQHTYYSLVHGLWADGHEIAAHTSHHSTGYFSSEQEWIDEVRAGYMLLATMGLLTAERLNLNVPRYDPAAYYNLVKTAPTSSSKQGKQLDRVLKSLGKE